MNARKAVSQIERELRAASKPGRGEYEKRYLKSKLDFIGADAAALHACAKRFARENKGISRASLLDIADAMWATGLHEVRSVAVLAMIELSDQLGPAELPRLRRWVVESDGWAIVDTIGTRLLPRMVAKDARVLAVMDKWAVAKSLWVRRAAMLSLLLPLRSGDLTEWRRFVRYATPQLSEKEFFIRKAIGWVLREVSKKSPDAVFEFLMKNRAAVSGLTLREGSKYLPAPMRKKLGL